MAQGETSLPTTDSRHECVSEGLHEDRASPRCERVLFTSRSSVDVTGLRGADAAHGEDQMDLSWMSHVAIVLSMCSFGVAIFRDVRRSEAEKPEGSFFGDLRSFTWGGLRAGAPFYAAGLVLLAVAAFT